MEGTDFFGEIPKENRENIWIVSEKKHGLRSEWRKNRGADAGKAPKKSGDKGLAKML